MDQLHFTTASHQKGKQLSFEERVIIQLRLKDNYSIRAIAAEIGCSPTTVLNEIKRGTVTLYNGHVTRYKASAGQDAYKENRSHCGRNYDFVETSEFLDYVAKHFFDDNWTLDACYGRALLETNFLEHKWFVLKLYITM